jgi:multidrug efflux pump subunit AcrA (membrane-fusion protein)
MTRNPKVVLPIVTLLVGFVAAGGMIAARRAVPSERPERPLPLVRALRVEPERVQLTVDTRGTVVPRTESDLVAEVTGRIVWVSPRLAAGGFVEPDDVLVRIDAADYEIALDRARASLTRAESDLELARATLARQQQLRASGVDSTASFESAVNAARVAEAMRDEAEAALRQAERDLARTAVRAPASTRSTTRRCGCPSRTRTRHTSTCRSRTATATSRSPCPRWSCARGSRAASTSGAAASSAPRASSTRAPG